MKFLKRKRSKSGSPAEATMLPGEKPLNAQDVAAFEECEALAGDVGVISRTRELGKGTANPALPEID